MCADVETIRAHPLVLDPLLDLFRSSYLSLFFSLYKSRRQLKIDQNKRKRESDKPNAPFPLGGYDPSSGGYVASGEHSDQSISNKG